MVALRAPRERPDDLAAAVPEVAAGAEAGWREVLDALGALAVDGLSGR